MYVKRRRPVLSLVKRDQLLVVCQSSRRWILLELSIVGAPCEAFCEREAPCEACSERGGEGGGCWNCRAKKHPRPFLRCICFVRAMCTRQTGSYQRRRSDAAAAAAASQCNVRVFRLSYRRWTPVRMVFFCRLGLVYGW